MKLKIKNILILIILIIMCAAGFLYLKKDNKPNIKEKSSYSSSSINKMEELNIKDKVNLKKYSKTLDIAINSSLFNIDNIKYYEKIKYYDNDKLIEYINTLVKNDLAINEINDAFKNFILYSNFDINNVKRYIAYKNINQDLDNQDIVTRVNLNLDKSYYSDTKRIEDQDNIYALVNKYNYVDMDYVPSNLKSLSNNSSIKMVDVAADAYEEFVNAAKNNGITLVGTTSYRSASFQKQLYDSYVDKDGKEKADTYSARPGYSEHQLGYSVDLNDPNYSAKRISDSDYKWIKENCYKYGFIVRYPENTENITGYQHENWHIRYVGKDAAKKIHELNITFDEYYDLYIVKH